MNRQCKCTDCGYVFDYEDRTVVKESHGFNDGFCETFSCCPNCGGDFEDAADSCECGETFTENELYSGWCEKCLRETINYETFFEYCEAYREYNVLDDFVMSELFDMVCPKKVSDSFHELMIQVYKSRCNEESDFLDKCIHFALDDKTHYADWLNKREKSK